MRSTVRHGSVAIGFLLAISAEGCTHGTAAGGLMEETFSGDVGGAPFGPAVEATDAGAPVASAAGESGTHRYQTTASVGDFLQITIDKDAHTVTYLNKTNGLAGVSVPYTIDAKGAYVFADPNGHLKVAIELEDHAFVVDVDKAGPNKDSRALAIGAATLPISLADVTNRRLNMMQFRTKNGGMEVGSAILTTQGNGLTVDLQAYWPRGAMAVGDHPFHVGRMGTLPVQENPGEHDFLTLTETEHGIASTDYVFKTASGLAIDMSNGNIVMLEQPDSKDFDAASVGTYSALSYSKQSAKGGPDDEPEPGDMTVERIDLTVGASGHVIAVDQTGATVMDGDLTPVPDVDYLTGAGKLNPLRCNGIFTFRAPVSAGNRELFVIFTKNGLLFSSFAPRATENGDAAYDYFYGAAVKQR